MSCTAMTPTGRTARITLGYSGRCDAGAMSGSPSMTCARASSASSRAGSSPVDWKTIAFGAFWTSAFTRPCPCWSSRRRLWPGFRQGNRSTCDGRCARWRELVRFRGRSLVSTGLEEEIHGYVSTAIRSAKNTAPTIAASFGLPLFFKTSTDAPPPLIKSWRRWVRVLRSRLPHRESDRRAP